MQKINFTKKKTEVVSFVAWEDGSEEELLIPIPDGFHVFHYLSPTEGDCIYIVPDNLKCSEEEIGNDYLVPMGKGKLSACLKLNLTHVYSPMVEEMYGGSHPIEAIITKYLLDNEERASGFCLNNQTSIELDASCRLFGIVTAALLADSGDERMITAAGRGGFLRVGCRIYCFQGVISLGNGIAKTASDAFEKVSEQWKEIQKWTHKIQRAKGTEKITKKDFKSFFVERMMLEINQGNAGRILTWDDDLPEWNPVSSESLKSHEPDVDVAITEKTRVRATSKTKDTKAKRSRTEKNNSVTSDQSEYSIQPEIHSDPEKEKTDSAKLDKASLIEYLMKAEEIEKAVSVAQKAYNMAKKGCVKKEVNPRKIEKRNISDEIKKPTEPTIEKYQPIPVPEKKNIALMWMRYVILSLFNTAIVGALILLAIKKWDMILWEKNGVIICAITFFPAYFVLVMIYIIKTPQKIIKENKKQKRIPIIIQTNKENETAYQKALEDSKVKYKESLEQYQKALEHMEKQAQEEYRLACAQRDAEYQRECEIAEENYTLVKNETNWLRRSLDEVKKTRERLYSFDYVTPPYRNWTAVSAFIEYFESGRAKSLEGFRGAYSIFDLDSEFKKEITRKDVYECKDVKKILAGLSKNISSIVKSETAVLSEQIVLNKKTVEIAAGSQLTSIINYVLETNSEVEDYIAQIDEIKNNQEEKPTVSNLNDEEVIETEGEKPDILGNGDTIEFGCYQQSGDDVEKQPIKWIVLKREKGKALLISEKVLSCKPYEAKPNGAPWKNCSLRKWLNSEFLKTAFDEQEQKRILKTTVVEDYVPSPASQGKIGTKTEDRVFLLSVPEAYEYYPTADSRKCEYTEFAKNEDEDKGEDGGWWLRSPGIIYDRFARVSNDDGEIYNLLCLVQYGVRPVIWIEA